MSELTLQEKVTEYKQSTGYDNCSKEDIIEIFDGIIKSLTSLPISTETIKEFNTNRDSFSDTIIPNTKEGK